MEVNLSQAILYILNLYLLRTWTLLQSDTKCLLQKQCYVSRKWTGSIFWNTGQNHKTLLLWQVQTNKSCFTEPPLCNFRFTLSISYSYVCSTRTLMQLIGTKVVNKIFCTLHEVNLSNVILYVILPSVHQGPEHFTLLQWDTKCLLPKKF